MRKTFDTKRSTVLRRFGVGVGITALTLVAAAVPSTAQAATSGGKVSRAVHPNTSSFVPVTRVPSDKQFIPPDVREDRSSLSRPLRANVSRASTAKRLTNSYTEFNGHGPDVDATAALGGFGTRNLTVSLCMDAIETRSDFTHASGCSGSFVIFTAPPGECVQSVSRETFDELVYRDTNVNIDVFGPQNAASFVQRWESTGDTRGEDAGVKTGVDIFTAPMIVNTAPGFC